MQGNNITFELWKKTMEEYGFLVFFSKDRETAYSFINVDKPTWNQQISLCNHINNDELFNCYVNTRVEFDTEFNHFILSNKMYICTMENLNYFVDQVCNKIQDIKKQQLKEKILNMCKE